MSSVFILVDDKPITKAELPAGIGREIKALTGGLYRTALVPNVIIRHALPQIRDEFDKQVKELNPVVGILVDLVDQDNKDPEGGIGLLRKLKADAVLKDVDVVIYTGYPVGTKENLWKAEGARAVIQRDMIKSKKRPERDIAIRILDAFGIPHT
jgi:hypothetical protein